MDNKRRPGTDSFSKPGSYGHPRINLHTFQGNQRALSRRPVRPQPTVAPPATSKTQSNRTSGPRKDVNISINLSLPAAIPKVFDLRKKLSGNRKKLPFGRSLIQVSTIRSIISHKYTRMATGTVMVLVTVWGIWQLFGPKTTPPNEQPAVQGAQVSTTPEFEAVVPSNKKEVERKYDPQRRVLSYSDTVNGVAITVSQQQLPEAFKLDPQGSVKTMAEKFNATTPLDAGDGVIAYVGKSANGPQSIIFQKDSVLIFMYAAKELDKESIISYIKILEK